MSKDFHPSVWNITRLKHWLCWLTISTWGFFLKGTPIHQCRAVLNVNTYDNTNGPLLFIKQKKWHSNNQQKLDMLLDGFMHNSNIWMKTSPADCSIFCKHLHNFWKAHQSVTKKTIPCNSEFIIVICWAGNFFRALYQRIKRWLSFLQSPLTHFNSSLPLPGPPEVTVC